MTFLTDMAANASTLIFGYLLPFLFVLTVVVFVHEMGHFLVGRWCGVRVEAFAIGFGPELAGFTDRKGTRWKLCAIPLGGYVKFFGDSNSASVPDLEAMQAMTTQERAVSFPHKTVLQRSAIVAAGPVANFLLAIAIFAGFAWAAGQYVVLPRIDAVTSGSAAERAGIRPGDLVIAINDVPVESFSAMQRIVSQNAGERLALTLDRNGRMITVDAVPDLKENRTRLGVQRMGLLGLQASRDPADRKHVTYGPIEALGFGVVESWHIIERTFDYLGKLIIGRESADQLSGPLRIAQASGVVAETGGLVSLMSLIGILSVSIGLINLFPVPLLDGGHLTFYAIEALRGRPLEEKTQEIGFRIGMALVMLLMIFATWNDIVHLASIFTVKTP
jgi:regulator of sigma E protease